MTHIRRLRGDEHEVQDSNEPTENAWKLGALPEQILMSLVSLFLTFWSWSSTSQGKFMPLCHSFCGTSISMVTVRRPSFSSKTFLFSFSLSLVVCFHFSCGLKPEPTHTSFVELDPGAKNNSSVGGATKHDKTSLCVLF